MVERPKVLAVDDRPENLLALSRVLDPLHVDVYQSTTGSEALGMALEHDFCVAIIDVQMPEMSGYDLVELLRGNQDTAHVPVIFVSAIYSDEYNHRRGYDAGAVDFLSKPFAPEVLSSKVKVFIRLWEQRRELNHLVESLNQANKQLAAANAQLSVANHQLAQANHQLGLTNNQLAVVNKELESFASSVSHDLRAPLRAINSFSRILAEEHAGEMSAEARQILGRVSANAVRMNELIDGLLQFSRMAYRTLARQRISLKHIAQEIITELRAQEPERAMEVLLPDLPDVHADPLLMRQVLVNLIGNAFKYTRKRAVAQVEIGCDCDPDGQAVYYVRDNGVGFDMRYAEKLFGIFQRLHSDEQFEGTGVGLAIVKRIVVRHGGRIWAEAAPDAGATFRFTLPPEVIL